MDTNLAATIFFGLLGTGIALWGISTNKKVHEKFEEWFPSLKRKGGNKVSAAGAGSIRLSAALLSVSILLLVFSVIRQISDVNRLGSMEAEVKTLTGVIGELKTTIEAKDQELTNVRKNIARNSPITRWSPASPRHIRLVLETSALLEEAKTMQVGVVCRAADNSVDFLADPVRQFSRFFRITGESQTIDLPLNDKLLERMKLIGNYQCAPVLAPLGKITNGTKVEVLGQRVGGLYLRSAPDS